MNSPTSKASSVRSSSPRSLPRSSPRSTPRSSPRSSKKFGKSKYTHRRRRSSTKGFKRATISQHVARETRRAAKAQALATLGTEFYEWPLFADEYQQHVGRDIRRMTDAHGRRTLMEDLSSVMLDIDAIQTPTDKHAIYPRMKREYIITDKADIDFDWINRQLEYIANLSIKDAYLLRSYTWVADRLINNALRGSLQRQLFFELMEKPTYNIFHNPFLFYYMYDNRIVYQPTRRKDREPTFNKEDLIAYLRTNFDRCLELYKADLTRIIEAAPRPTREIVVYRGVETTEYLDDIRLRYGPGRPFKPVDFQSTSLKAKSAFGFADQHEGAIIQLRIKPGTPCVYLAPLSHFQFYREQEILLPPNITLTYNPSPVGERFRRYLDVKENPRDFKQIIDNYDYNTMLYSDYIGEPLRSMNPNIWVFYMYEFDVNPASSTPLKQIQLGFRKIHDDSATSPPS